MHVPRQETERRDIDDDRCDARVDACRGIVVAHVDERQRSHEPSAGTLERELAFHRADRARERETCAGFGVEEPVEQDAGDDEESRRTRCRSISGSASSRCLRFSSAPTNAQAKPSPSRGGFGWGWCPMRMAARDENHPHPSPPLEGEGESEFEWRAIAHAHKSGPITICSSTPWFSLSCTGNPRSTRTMPTGERQRAPKPTPTFCR